MSYRYFYDGREFESFDSLREYMGNPPHLPVMESWLNDDIMFAYNIQRLEIPDPPAPPEPETVEEAQDRVRGVRNVILASTDCTMLPDYPVNEVQRQSYIQYRQYLRDYTKEENWWERLPLSFDEWARDENEAFFEESN